MRARTARASGRRRPPRRSSTRSTTGSTIGSSSAGGSPGGGRRWRHRRRGGLGRRRPIRRRCRLPSVPPSAPPSRARRFGAAVGVRPRRLDAAGRLVSTGAWAISSTEASNACSTLPRSGVRLHGLVEGDDPPRRPVVAEAEHVVPPIVERPPLAEIGDRGADQRVARLAVAVDVLLRRTPARPRDPAARAGGSPTVRPSPSPRLPVSRRPEAFELARPAPSRRRGSGGPTGPPPRSRRAAGPRGRPRSGTAIWRSAGTRSATPAESSSRSAS